MTRRSYPLRVPHSGGDVAIRPMTGADEAAVLAFARRQDPHDLLFLPRDISAPKVLAAWIKEIERGGMTSLAVVRGEDVVGCGALARDPLSWSPHVGELRVLVGREVRREGVGRALSQEMFALALEAGLEKIVAQMTVDQVAAIGVFEGLGFRAEALLRDHVKGRDGRKHDIVVLGHDVAEALARIEAYGLHHATQS